jgi:hypothetical protein
VGALLSTTKHGAGHRLALCLPVRAGTEESQREERSMYAGYTEFLAFLGITAVWALIMYAIAVLKGE